MDKEHILFVHIDICVHVCCTAWAQVHRMRYGELKGCLHLHTFLKKCITNKLSMRHETQKEKRRTSI